MIQEDLKQYLEPTEFLDFDKKIVKKVALEVTKGLKTDKEKIIALFYWVRDQIKYNAFSYFPKVKANLKASTTIRRMYGFCMSKAVTLAALARAVGIPARIHMVDIINHKVSKRIVDIMGTTVFHCHGYSEIYLDDNWLKLTPVFDHETSLKGGFIPELEFYGENDALFEKYDKDGKPFVEYIADWGIYSDVPIEKIDEIFRKNYPKWYSDDENFPSFFKINKNQKEALSLNK